MKYAVYSITALILIGGLLFNESLMGGKLAFSASITGFLDGFKGNSLEAKIAKLEQENEALRVELFNQNLAKPDTFKVYSIYPFNNIKEIAIAGGEAAGQKPGGIVTYNKNILVGKVRETEKNHSVVETIFDPNFKAEVRVGESQADALFTGGHILKLSLLAKNADIKVGDLVVTAAKGYPYGLGVGRVREIINNLGKPLKEAIVQPIIQLEDLRDVSVSIPN